MPKKDGATYIDKVLLVLGNRGFIRQSELRQLIPSKVMRHYVVTRLKRAHLIVVKEINGERWYYLSSSWVNTLRLRFQCQ